MKVSIGWLEDRDVPGSCFWTEVVSERRWYDVMQGAFRADDKVYLVNYTEDASESQDGQFDSPFEAFQDSNGFVEIREAVSYEIVKTVWRRK